MIEHKGYTGVFEYDPELDVLTGHVVDIGDEIYFEGKSIDEVRKNMASLVDEYLRVCEERGDDPDRPFSGNLRLRMDSQLHRQVVREAAISGTSLNRYIVEALKQRLGS